MVQINDQLVALNRSQLEAALKFAEITSETVEKFAGLQFQAAKSAFADGVKTAKQFSSVKDVSEFAALSGSFQQPTWEKAQSFAKSVYEVAATTHAELTSLLEEQLGELNKNVAGVLDGAVKNAPGSEGAVAAVKSVIQSASAMYESVLKASKQMATIAESSAQAAAATVVAPRKKTA